jgi:uncharacterized membrane protein (DUF2068 family)
MRPICFTLIAIWFWFRSLMWILLSLGLALAGGLAGRVMSALSAGAGMQHFLASLGTFLSIAVGIIAFLNAAAGIGVWLMKSWGRILAIVLAALSLASSIRILFHPHPLNLIRPVVDIAIIGYLIVPSVGAKFS